MKHNDKNRMTTNGKWNTNTENNVIVGEIHDTISVFHINFPIDSNSMKLCCCFCLFCFVLYLFSCCFIVHLNLSLINTVRQTETISLVFFNLLLINRTAEDSKTQVSAMKLWSVKRDNQLFDNCLIL